MESISTSLPIKEQHKLAKRPRAIEIPLQLRLELFPEAQTNQPPNVQEEHAYATRAREFPIRDNFPRRNLFGN